MKKKLSGFTLPELIVVVGILMILLSISSINLLTIYGKTSLGTKLSTLISDIKHQQLKSIVGDTEGETSAESYGIYFEQNRYTLFKGSSYSASDPLNFIINLESDLQFSNIAFPQSQLVFSQGSGEISAYTSDTDTVTLTNIRTSDSKTLELNRYGVVVTIN